MTEMKTVFLVGYMGCGKTTLGVALARVMRRRFIDLDEEVEREQGRTVKEIFTEQGEDAFRALEKEALRRVATVDGAIVACGGGTPCVDGAMELMNGVGVTVWLDANAKRIAARLCLPEEKVKRPQVAALHDDEVPALVAQGLAERTPYYSQAVLRFDSTFLESADQIEASARSLAALLEAYSIERAK